MRMFLWVKCQGISDVYLMFDTTHVQFVLFGGLLIDTQSGVLLPFENGLSGSISLFDWPAPWGSWHEVPA